MGPITPHNQQEKDDFNLKLKQINKIVSEFKKETDRGLAILAASMLDQKLKIILSNYLIKCKQSDLLLNSPGAPISTFSARLNMAFSLGLISEDEYHDSEVIRKIRNDFAHKFELEFSFNNPSVSDKCKNMKIIYAGGATIPQNDARTIFWVTAASIEYRWLYREQHAHKMRTPTLKWDDVVFPLRNS